MTLRRWVAAVVAALAFLVGAFVLGRSTAPTRVETREHVVYQDRWRTEYVHDQAQAKTAEQAASTRVITRWVRVTTPAGEQREEMVTDTAAATSAKTAEASSSHEKATSERDLFVDHSKERIVTQSAPPWSATLLAGWSKLQARPDTAGIVVQRDIIGPVSVGGWLMVGKVPGDLDVTGGVALTLRVGK